MNRHHCPKYRNVVCVGGPMRGTSFDVGPQGVLVAGTQYGIGRMTQTADDGSIEELIYLAPRDWTTFDVMIHLIENYNP